MPSTLNAWKELPYPPTANAYTLMAYGGLVWGFGDNYVGTFDPVSEIWTQRSSLSISSTGSVCRVGSLMYHAPGSTFRVWDFDALTWTALAPIPNHQFGAALCAAPDGSVWAIGGRAPSPSVSINDVRRYDPATDTWTTIGNILTPGMGDWSSGGTDSHLSEEGSAVFSRDGFLYYWGGQQATAGGSALPEGFLKVDPTAFSVAYLAGEPVNPRDLSTGHLFKKKTGEDIIWTGPERGSTFSNGSPNVITRLVTSTAAVTSLDGLPNTGAYHRASQSGACGLDGDYYALVHSFGTAGERRFYVYGAYTVGEIVTGWSGDAYITEDIEIEIELPEFKPPALHLPRRGEFQENAHKANLRALENWANQLDDDNVHVWPDQWEKPVEGDR